METLYEYVINGLTFGHNKYKIGINNNNARIHTYLDHRKFSFEGGPLSFETANTFYRKS